MSILLKVTNLDQKNEPPAALIETHLLDSDCRTADRASAYSRCAVDVSRHQPTSLTGEGVCGLAWIHKGKREMATKTKELNRTMLRLGQEYAERWGHDWRYQGAEIVYFKGHFMIVKGTETLATNRSADVLH